MAADARSGRSRRAATCLVYPLTEAASLLGKDPRTLRRAYDRGEVPGKRLGRDILVPRAWVHEYAAWPQEAAS